MGNITKPYFTDSERDYVRSKYWNVGKHLRESDTDVKSIPGWNNRQGNSIGIIMFWVK